MDSQASDLIAEKLEKLKSGGKDAARQATGLPSLSDLFHVGQLVRGVVLELEQGTSKADASTDGKEGHSRRKGITLSLLVSRLNAGVAHDALVSGVPIAASVRSVEDHGYTLTFGIKVSPALP